MRLSNLLLAQALLVSAGCAFPASGARAAEDGAVVERKAYDFPSYERAVETTDVEKYADKAAYERAVGDAKFQFEKLKYLSDGLKVVAYVYGPRQTGGRKLPAVVFNRGSGPRGDVAPELVAFFHRLAMEGFVIIAPMLRQSDGSEGRDEMGGADVDDLMNVLPLAKSLAYVDTNNMFMYGESRGGMMTYQAVRRGFPVNAAAVFGAFTDARELVDSHPKQYSPAVLKQIWPDYEGRKDEIFKSRSAVLWAERLNVPLLIMHGGSDKSVSPEQSLSLAQRLQKLGRVYELVVYAGDNHILSDNMEDRDRRAVGWFRRHMKK
ncbi:MAG TPA: prolyl oligopeptidase family serine peptidase [Pyrinomonadaceae bacterium]|jgi:dipeptidyl aminopeptidase/acylaminoacyl peptidase|nr:prolyl oligopeptidase family serine peptidase [Pyrinomonadaceae bacterium]